MCCCHFILLFYIFLRDEDNKAIIHSTSVAKLFSYTRVVASIWQRQFTIFNILRQPRRRRVCVVVNNLDIFALDCDACSFSHLIYGMLTFALATINLMAFTRYLKPRDLIIHSFPFTCCRTKKFSSYSTLSRFRNEIL